MTSATTATSKDTAAADTQLPGNAPAELAPYVESRVITRDDVAAVAMLVAMARRDDPSFEPSLLAWLAIALAVRTPRDGHTCVDFEAVQAWCGDIDLSQAGHLDWPTDAPLWIAALDSAKPLVGSVHARAPLILEGSRLYLARSLHEEEEIARRLTGADAARVEILLGGPGTG